MLRRGSSKSSNRLSRRKSTSSTISKPDSIDPEFARQQAQAAALYAFERARERQNADSHRSHTLPRNNDFVSYQSFGDTSGHENAGQQVAPALRRQQSVRFAGPNAATARPSIGTRALRPTVETKASSNTLRPRALTTSGAVPAVYRPPSRSSSIGRASVGRGRAESFMTAVAAYDEYHTREDDVASTPSSYKRIRKSKSFMSPANKLPSIFFHNGIQEQGYTATLRSQSRTSGTDDPPPLRGPRSMSFLRGSKHRASLQRQDPDAAVQAARDKFLHQLEQQRLREQPSFIFRSKARRNEKEFRRSLRSSSANNYGLPVASENQISMPKETAIRIKARKASQTIKNKLKGLFKRGTDREEAVIPQQQVEAMRTHNVDYVGGAQRKSDLFLDIPLPDSATVSRVASRVPSLHTVPSNQQLKSRTGSLQSLRSDCSSKSRVTSWTSTALDNTANSRHAQAERERQRLSIIQENGTHISSSSFGRRRIPSQFSAQTAVPRPRSSHAHPPRGPGHVDSQKVYAALMKRLDENSPKARLAQRMASVESLGPPTPIPPRTSSIGSGSCGTPATIRQVCEVNVETVVPSGTQASDDVFSAKNSDGVESTNIASHARSASTLPNSVHQKPSYSAFPPPVMGDIVRPTPQQMAIRNEPVLPQSRILRESRSGFFGQSSFSTVSRTTSPYRRALAESGYNPAAITKDSLLDSVQLVAASNPAEDLFNMIDFDRSEEMIHNPVYTESIYSRTTSGRTPGVAASTRSLRLVEDDLPLFSSDPPIAVVRPKYRLTPIPSYHQAKLSTDSSEWKTWMSTQVFSLENTKENEPGMKVDYALSSMPKAFGHVREHAQIDDDDTEIASRKITKSKQPLGLIQQNVQPKPILKNKSSFKNLVIPIPPPPPAPPPPVPNQSHLRAVQSRSSMKSTGTASVGRTMSAPSSIMKVSSTNGRHLSHARSNATLRSLDTPARLIKKNGRPSHLPSPGITAAVERQFGSAGPKIIVSGTENHIPIRDELYGVDGAGLMGPRHDPQALGSKRMVENFLSSRRRRVAGSDESNAFI